MGNHLLVILLSQVEFFSSLIGAVNMNEIQNRLIIFEVIKSFVAGFSVRK